MRHQTLFRGSSAASLLLALLCCGVECRAQSGTGLVSIWYLNGIGVIGSPNTTYSSLWRVAGIGNFNQDGIPDLLLQNPLTGDSQVWFMGTGGNTIASAVALSGQTTWRIVGVGDFNGDGHPDVVWQDSMTGDSQVWYLDGTQALNVIGAAALSVPNAWQIVAVADFNGDGHPDLVWQDVRNSGTVQIWYMNGPTFVSAVQVAASNTFRIVAAGNFRGDANETDLVWQDLSGAGAVPVWYLQHDGAGTQTLIGSDFISTGNLWTVVGAGDFNGDGHPDLVWQDLARTPGAPLDPCYAQLSYTDQVLAFDAADIYSSASSWITASEWTNITEWTANVNSELLQIFPGSPPAQTILWTSQGWPGWAPPGVSDTADHITVSSANFALPAQGGTFQELGNHHATNALCGVFPVTAGQSPQTLFPAPPVTVTVDPTTANLAYNQAIVIAATVIGSTNTDVTWTRSPGTCGTLEYVDGTHVRFVAPPNLGSCNYTDSPMITATSVADPTRSASVQVTLTSGGSIILSPSSGSYLSTAYSSLTIYVSAPPGTSWSATKNGDWIHFTGTTSGTGPGSVSFSIDANTGTSGRLGTITIADQTFTATQAAASTSSATKTISGQVTYLGNAVTGVLVTLSGSANASTTTDSTGHYAFQVQSGGTYSLRPSSPLYTFTPPDMMISNISTDFAAPFQADRAPQNPVPCANCNGVWTDSYSNVWTLDTNWSVSDSSIIGTVTTKPPAAGCPVVHYSVTGSLTRTAGSAGPPPTAGITSFSVDATNPDQTSTDNCVVAGHVQYVGQISNGFLGCRFGSGSYTNDLGGSGSFTWSKNCLLPSSETTSPSTVGWNPDVPTAYFWQAQLNATSDFAGRTVEEAQDGTGSDSCHFVGSAVEQYRLTGGGWYVGTLGYNTYGYDLVGWAPGAVLYYRSNGKTPCAATVLQKMQIYCYNSLLFPLEFYKYNTISVGIDTLGSGTVSSSRDNQEQGHFWP